MSNQMVIIILNYNFYNDTIETVNNLIKIGVEDDIVIVDNCSINESYESLLNNFGDVPNISIIKSFKNGGYSYGNNYGINYALNRKQYEFICILNPDVIIPHNYFASLCSKISSCDEYAAISPIMLSPDMVDFSEIGGKIVTAKQHLKFHSIIYRKYFWKREKDCVYKHVGNGLIESERLPGSFFIIKTIDFKNVGYFDEDIFLYGEEGVIAQKIKSIGKTCLIDSNFYYIHNHRSSIPLGNVWERYRKDFSTILEGQKRYNNTMETICKKYYKGKYLYSLKLVGRINIMLLYVKRVIAYLRR